jgi:hypothetical protein
MSNWIKKLEIQWKSDLPKFTPKFLRETFPKAWKNVIPSKVKELKREHDDLAKKIRCSLNRANSKDDGAQIVLRSIIKQLVVPRLIDLERDICRLERLLIIREVRPKNVRRKIELAKEKPILDVAALNGCEFRRSGKNYRMKCRFHEDRTPSLYFYPQTNSFYCFGCQKGGDVIQFTQDLLGLSFVESINYLNHH